MIQQRSLSTNIPLVETYRPNLHSISVSLDTNQSDLNDDDRGMVTSTSFTRTASKKRREFSKDKRHDSSIADFPNISTNEHSTLVYHVRPNRSVYFSFI